MTGKWIARLVIAALILSSLTACAGKGAGSAAPTDDANAVDYSSGTPWPYIDLEGVVTPDTTTDLKDNFALYVNKDKILNLKIPQGRPFWRDLYESDPAAVGGCQEYVPRGST